MNTRRLEFWILFADLAWTGLAFLGADLLRFGLAWEPEERASIHALLPFVLATCAIWVALSAFMQMDGFRGGWKLSTVFFHLLFGIACTFAVTLTLGYLIRSYVSRLALTYFMLLLVGGFLAVRCLARLVLRWKYEGGDVWRVAILGSGRVAQEVASKLESHPEMLCKVVGMLFPNQDAEELMVPGLRHSQAIQVSTLGIFDLLRTERVNEVIIAIEQPLSPEIRTLIGRIRDLGIETTLVPQSYELYAFRSRLVTIDELPLVQLRDPGLRMRYRLLKRAMDLLISSLLLLPSWIFLAPICFVLWMKRKKALRSELRCGQYNQPFRMLRLNVDRPLRSNSEFETFLDRMSMTELPQLWNVWRGHMSLVGPRPDQVDRTSQYSGWQQRRLKVKPGMTGLAQVHGLREYSSLEQKARFDLQYALNPYLLWDVSLLMQTFWTLFLRLFSNRKARTFDVNWKQQSSGKILPNANRTQSSAD
jgi:lipopolysaccharide/colanic/teichoic acid biosynthesis glycosyltransferase